MIRDYFHQRVPYLIGGGAGLALGVCVTMTGSSWDVGPIVLIGVVASLISIGVLIYAFFRLLVLLAVVGGAFVALGGLLIQALINLVQALAAPIVLLLLCAVSFLIGKWLYEKKFRSQQRRHPEEQPRRPSAEPAARHSTPARAAPTPSPPLMITARQYCERLCGTCAEVVPAGGIVCDEPECEAPRANL